VLTADTQHDLWWKIASAALSGKPDRVDLNYHPALDQAAVSRYAATTPKQLKWFSGYNENRTYEQQVKPFGFLYALHARTLAAAEEEEEIVPFERGRVRRRLPANCKPVAPYDADIVKATGRCFDRDSGIPVDAGALKSFKQVLAPYHLHPESKFLNGDYLDRGVTRRRYVYAAAVRNIGKEANEWEPQFYLGFDEDKQIDYGFAPKRSQKVLRALREEIKAFGGQRKLALESGIARQTVARLISGKRVRPGILTKIRRALAKGSRS
jgi:hypothetical protein